MNLRNHLLLTSENKEFIYFISLPFHCLPVNDEGNRTSYCRTDIMNLQSLLNCIANTRQFVPYHTLFYSCPIPPCYWGEKLPCVKSSVIAEKGHVQEAALTAWEQKNGCTLPQDLKNFYLATDGLQIKWFWRQKGETVAVGSIEITRLGLLKSIGPKRQSINSELPTLLDIESDSEETCDGHIKPKFKDGCKIFVLDHCQGAGKVCLVYPKKKDSSGDSSQVPSVWFLDRALDFHYLTSDFASYYRLALAHLGIPQWQLLFTPYGPPTRTRLLLNMFAPERLVQKPTS